MISFEEFKRLELKVARIIAAQRIPNSENLLKLQIDLGNEQRQIVAGIAKFYSPESLVSKEIIVIANLESKTFTLRSDSGQVDIESQGMLLAADRENPVLLVPDKEVTPGSPIS